MASERVQRVLEQAKALTGEERTELEDELLRIDQDEELDVTAEEIQRRIHEVETGAVECIPWEQVEADLIAELRTTPRG